MPFKVRPVLFCALTNLSGSITPQKTFFGLCTKTLLVHRGPTVCFKTPKNVNMNLRSDEFFFLKKFNVLFWIMHPIRQLDALSKRDTNF